MSTGKANTLKYEFFKYMYFAKDPLYSDNGNTYFSMVFKDFCEKNWEWGQNFI